MSYITSKSLHLSNRDFFVGTNSYDSTTVPSNEVKLTDSTGAAFDFFGQSVAVGDGRIVVTANGDDDDGSGTGSASIFDLNGTLIAKITGDTAGFINFGRCCAVGNGRIAIGATGESNNAGAVYIFDLQGNQLTKVFASDSFNDQRFGTSVAIGSGRIVVGASDSLLQNTACSAYIFDLDGNQISRIEASDTTIGDGFGDAVAIGSGRIVVGAPLSDSGGITPGGAYIFDLDGNFITKIVASDAADVDRFGISVAAGHGRIVVGAYFDDDVFGNSGSAYIFDLDGNELAKITASDPGTSDTFGAAVAIGSGRIVVGSTSDDNERGSNAGATYVFDLSGNQIAKIVASDGAASDFAGGSVSVGSGKIIVGADGNDAVASSAGAAYVYDTPIQKHFLDQLD